MSAAPPDPPRDEPRDPRARNTDWQRLAPGEKAPCYFCAFASPQYAAPAEVFRDRTYDDGTVRRQYACRRHAEAFAGGSKLPE
jgi:hypothetical protein